MSTNNEIKLHNAIELVNSTITQLDKLDQKEEYRLTRAWLIYSLRRVRKILKTIELRDDQAQWYRDAAEATARRARLNG